MGSLCRIDRMIETFTDTLRSELSALDRRAESVGMLSIFFFQEEVVWMPVKSNQCLTNLILRKVGCLLESYVLATSTVILGWVPTCDSAHSWWLYITAQLGDHATSTMTWYPSLSHNTDTKPTSLCPIVIMLSAWLGSGKCQFLSHWFDLTRVWTPRSTKIGDKCSTHLAILSGGATGKWRWWVWTPVKWNQCFTKWILRIV